MLKPIVPKSHPHLSVHLKDVAKKAGPRLRPIVGTFKVRYD